MHKDPTPAEIQKEKDETKAVANALQATGLENLRPVEPVTDEDEASPTPSPKKVDE